MERIIRSAYPDKLEESLDLVEKVFTASEGAESGRLVRSLLAEIRSKKYYLPELDLIMTDENSEVIGQAAFSRFHIEGRYEDDFVILTPVAVKTELQRQHISKELIEHGLKKAKEMGFKFCMVEGNPRNYRPRGFVTSASFGVFAHESVGLPHEDCLMIQELCEGGLKDVHGYLSYEFYEALR